eukprot:m51a1_g8322 putative protein serine threonine kinase (454) ;mRNA; r:135260-137465
MADPGSQYELEEKLGEGSYGSVWKAKRVTDGQSFAIKRIPVDNDMDELQAEIEFMKGCRSPHIVMYLDSYVQSNELWIVMEYCGGGSVSDLMKVCGHPLQTEAQISLVCKYVIQGLIFLHSQRKLHRDIKAANVLMNDSGECKLADFGVSGQLADTMAKRHTVIGTPFWMAPEVIQEIGYNEKADIWSLGITAIELAEGKPPFSNVHPMRAIFMIPSKPPPTLTDVARWSPAFSDFLANCVVKDPRYRATAKDLLNHEFIKSAPTTTEVLLPLLEKQARIIAQQGREKALGLDNGTAAADDIPTSTFSATRRGSDAVQYPPSTLQIMDGTCTGSMVRRGGTTNFSNFGEAPSPYESQQQAAPEGDFDSGTRVFRNAEEEELGAGDELASAWKAAESSSKFSNWTTDQLTRARDQCDREYADARAAIDARYAPLIQQLNQAIDERKRALAALRS